MLKNNKIYQIENLILNKSIIILIDLKQHAACKIVLTLNISIIQRA